MAAVVEGKATTGRWVSVRHPLMSPSLSVDAVVITEVEAETVA